MYQVVSFAGLKIITKLNLEQVVIDLCMRL